jgi:hypothetical protein
LILHSYRDRAIGVIPIRLALGLALVGAARVAGARSGPALLAFVVGVFGITFVIFNDPRARFIRRDVDPLDAPPDAEIPPRWRQGLSATLPSTVAVAVLACVALVPQPTLAARLAGVEAGLGVAALLSLGRIDPELYVDPRRNVVYRRRDPT